MKRWLTFTLTLAVLMTFTKLAAEQKAANPKSPATGPTQYSQDSLRKGVPPSPPPPRPIDPKGLKLMTGKVTQVNPTAKTFTVMAKGKSVTFIAQAPGELTLLKVGQILDITYTQTPGGPMKAITTNTSKSNNY